MKIRGVQVTGSIAKSYSISEHIRTKSSLIQTELVVRSWRASRKLASLVHCQAYFAAREPYLNFKPFLRSSIGRCHRTCALLSHGVRYLWVLGLMACAFMMTPGAKTFLSGCPGPFWAPFLARLCHCSAAGLFCFCSRRSGARVKTPLDTDAQPSSASAGHKCMCTCTPCLCLCSWSVPGP